MTAQGADSIGCWKSADRVATDPTIRIRLGDASSISFWQELIHGTAYSSSLHHLIRWSIAERLCADQPRRVFRIGSRCADAQSVDRYGFWSDGQDDRAMQSGLDEGGSGSMLESSCVRVVYEKQRLHHRTWAGEPERLRRSGVGERREEVASMRKGRARIFRAIFSNWQVSLNRVRSGRRQEIDWMNN